MSSSVITVDTNAAKNSSDLRAALLRLCFRRRFQRASAAAMLALTCALALACLIAFVDYLWPLNRASRSALIATVALAFFAVIARATWSVIKRRTLREAALEIEQAARSKQNSLVTFAEYAQQAEDDASYQSYIFKRLERQAQNELGEAFDLLVASRRALRQSIVALAILLLFMFALRLGAPKAFAREAARILWLARDDQAITKFDLSSRSHETNDAHGFVVIDEFSVRVTPPAYTGLGVVEIPNSDASIRALAGSQIEVTLHARGEVDRATLGFGAVTNAMRALSQNRFSGTFTATTSGAFEARMFTSDESPAPSSVVRGVEVYTDATPEARITEPASDQLLRAVPDHAVDVRWTARDDLGLQSVALKYIKSRGEGDAAKFTGGDIGLNQIEHESAREWRGQAALDLARLDMQPGDTLVFWIEARDRNPFANNLGRSASLSIAVKGPEAFKLDLSDLRPSEIGRFLLSERLILMHTEKLHSEGARLAPNEFRRRSNDIAAEQREFKNSFSDYINIEGAGENALESRASQTQSVEDQAQVVADERVEIHHHGIPEPPPGAPASVIDMTLAIRAMWDAEDALAAGETAKALVAEREALTRLKRAQASARYVPPVLPRSKPLDLKRRYAGELAEIKTQLEKLARRSSSKDVAPIRAALRDAYSALAELQTTLGVPAIGRASAVGRARDKSQIAADRLASVGGDHAVTIAESIGQLRIVETELQRTETGGTSDEFATRIAKPLALLAQAASNLYAIAEQSTRAGDADASALAPADDARADKYFRRLMRRTAQ